MIHHLSPSVLIIEDEAIIGVAVAETARSVGCTVLGPASDSAEAIALASQTEPDLIISDVMLTDGGTGIGAMRAIRAFSDAPIIFLTGHSEALDGAAVGLSATVMAKPVDHSVLAKTIVKQLRQRPT